MMTTTHLLNTTILCDNAKGIYTDARGMKGPMSSALFNRIKIWATFFSKISYPRDIPLVVHAFQHHHTFDLPDEIWQKIENIGGYLLRKEAGLLYWAARHCPVSGAVLELGSYEGRSTGVFALAGRSVHAIDAWSSDVADLSAYDQGDIPADDVFQRFQNNLRQLQIEQLVSVNRGLTQPLGQKWNKEGAILFVDAGHTYEDVKGDLTIWTPHLHPQGFLIMHDVLGYNFLGVTQAAGELLKNGWQVIASSGSAVAFKRK
jgi:MMP 1-O-methyltransferase